MTNRRASKLWRCIKLRRMLEDAVSRYTCKALRTLSCHVMQCVPVYVLYVNGGITVPRIGSKNRSGIVPRKCKQAASVSRGRLERDS